MSTALLERLDAIAGDRVPLYVGFGLGLGLVSLYAGYSNPGRDVVQAGVGTTTVVIPRSTITLSVVLGTLVSIIQAFDTEVPLVSWFLVACPAVLGTFGFTVATATHGAGVSWVSVAVGGVVAVLGSGLLALAVFALRNAVLARTGQRLPVSTGYLLGTFSFVSFGTLLGYFVASGVLLLVV